MSPRQRRGILLLALSAIGLIVVFVIVAGYVGDVRRQVEPKVRILRLAKDIRADEDFSDDKLSVIELPERWAPRTAIRNRSQLSGLVAGTDMPRGSIVEQGMAVAPPELQAGQRELAILVDAETGVAGKLTPGAKVDIVATFAGNDQQKIPSRSRIVVAGARIIDIGAARARQQQSAQADPGQVVPVTFALSVRESLIVTYAESFAQEVRLSLVRRGEDSKVPKAERAYSLGR